MRLVLLGGDRSLLFFILSQASLLAFVGVAAVFFLVV